ncbi:hypothetical protein Amn_pc01150 (plasmid) [Aminobacter sp. Y103A]|uniref:hypothetical protein n=1 Tax=Phyllobacteriaceae TaxID=69277 RepID=UPI001936AADA|nr:MULTISPECIES: hypothetical protein [Phyllobacteriaceae]BBD41400.1 hypothetical protein Amn_pc01150 [Aminobacter sp. SS-2016]BCH20047.1 hypothetical protein MesoLjLa_68980 [Mesorhizobium sp. L-2-11]
MMLEKLRACWGFSPTVDRNVALVEGFLKGKRFADLAQEHGLSITRVRQIIERADRHVGGGIVTEAEPSKASPRSDFMVDYPYVWKLAELHRLGSVTPHHFFTELGRAGSLERLIDKMKRLPGRTPATTRELARLVWQKERDESPWPAMKRSNIAVMQPSCPVDHPDRGLQCQLALEPALQALVERAAESGWTEDEIAHALLELAGARLKGAATSGARCLSEQQP